MFNIEFSYGILYDKYLLPMTNFTGLSQEEADKKLKEFGYNQLHEIKKTSPLRILIRQIKSNYVLYLLLAAGLISFIVGKGITAYTIFAVIFAVITAGFIQEYRAEKAIESLKNMLMPVSRVLRNGKETEISSLSIVPYDIVLLRAGEKVPADCIVLEESEVRVDESVLTGESKEIKKFGTKDLETTKDEHKIFMGSFVVSGKCIGLVTQTGMRTKFGNIAGLVSTAEKVLPLQKKINKISTYMVFVALSMSLLTGFLLFTRAEVVNAEFLTNTLILVIALAVSAFPEGLPVVLIATLASGANKMAKKNAIINRMSVIESLGETTVICSDKTGTITTGEMTVRKILLDGTKLDVTGLGYSNIGEFMKNGKKFEGSENSQFEDLLRCAVLCNDSKIERLGEGDKYKVHGSSTEGALLIMAAKHKMYLEDLKYERLEDMPFTSERKMMSVLVGKGVKKYVFVKGAPEVVLQKCSIFLKNNKKIPLNSNLKEELLEENKSLAKNALRSLAFAYKEIDSNGKSYSEDKLIFLGIVGMEDPARDEAKQAISICEHAGIKVKLITGDNRHTAEAIARQVGIEGDVIEGTELDSMTDEQLKDEVKRISIFVRVEPQHKLRIVKALKENDEIVAMTGDGVNDAPALKEAHIGIAMGIKGTDVSRSVADVVLKDDNFATIVSAVVEGRTIFNNIRKFVSYQLSCNLSELSILFFGVLLAPFLGWEVPVLLAIQILFMNLVTDNLPALTLGFNPTSIDVLTKRKKSKTREILDLQLITILISTGLAMCTATLFSYYISFNFLGFSTDVSRTTALVTLILIEITTAFAYRSFRKQVLTRSPFVNKYLVLASLISILATIIIIYVPFLSNVFSTTYINWVSWAIAFALSITLLIFFDLGKEINRFIKFLPQH